MAYAKLPSPTRLGDNIPVASPIPLCMCGGGWPVLTRLLQAVIYAAIVVPVRCDAFPRVSPSTPQPP
jgi:hypothetical protein